MPQPLGSTCFILQNSTKLRFLHTLRIHMPRIRPAPHTRNTPQGQRPLPTILEYVPILHSQRISILLLTISALGQELHALDQNLSVFKENAAVLIAADKIIYLIFLRKIVENINIYFLHHSQSVGASSDTHSPSSCLTSVKTAASSST